MLISLLVACATMHQGPEGVEGDLIASPEDARLLMDGDLASEALGKSNGGKVPVTVTTSVQTRGQSSQTTVQVGYPNNGYGQPGGVMYTSASDIQLMQAARLAEDYRRKWGESNGMLPSSTPAEIVMNGQAGSVSTDHIDPDAKCPKGQPNKSWTDDELDKCQTDMLKAIVEKREVK